MKIKKLLSMGILGGLMMLGFCLDDYDKRFWSCNKKSGQLDKGHAAIF
jgi:hypothetical protein